MSAYAHVFKSKVHCGSAVRFGGGKSADPLITAHHLYAFFDVIGVFAVCVCVLLCFIDPRVKKIKKRDLQLPWDLL